MREKVSIEIFYFDAGSGHRSATSALKEFLAERCPEWLVTPVDLQKLLEPIDPLHKVTLKLSPSINKLFGKEDSSFSFQPIQSQAFYNYAVKKGAARGFIKMMPFLQEGIRKRSPEIEALIKQHWLCAKIAPDLVVSVIPNFNGVMYRALRSLHPDVPYLTVMTDMVDRAPFFWMEDQDQILVCGAEKAYTQARSSGFYEPENVFLVSGMVLNKKFYEPPSFSALTLEDMGLLRGRPTALVIFGGNGSMVSKKIVDRLNAAKLDVQTIVLCGHNKELFARMQNRKGCHAVGFVSNVADYMRVADFMIGKPGPGCISEAMHMGCPVIVESNASTLLQERPNVNWILEKGAGIVVRRFNAQIVTAVQDMIGNLELYRRNIKMNVSENRALFEVADVLENILASNRRAPPLTTSPQESIRQ